MPGKFIDDLACALGACTTVADTLAVVQSMTHRLAIPYQSCVIFLFGPGGVLVPALVDGPYHAELGRAGSLGLQHLFILQVLHDPRPYLNDDVSACTSEQPIFKDEHSMLVVPLMVSKENIGIIYLGSANPKTHTRKHLRKLTVLAALAAPSIKLALQAQQIAYTDGLTGLYLHTYFHTRLIEEIARADRSQKPICLAMVATDRFRRFNDTLGHPAGDTLLEDIAALLKESVRASDIVCRYAGDEFALILPDTPKEAGLRTCELIRLRFQLRFTASCLPVTASIGLACYPSDATTKKNLVKAADEALYVSKRQGRNRVTPAPTLDEK